MQLGTSLASRLIAGLPAGPDALAIQMEFLCDGGSRPDPGVSMPVAWDGQSLLSIMSPVQGTNHRAIYDAIYSTLDFALNAGATEVTIELLSHLVWSQIAEEGVGIN